MQSKNISIITPLYNEEKRMIPFVKKLLSYSKNNFKDYEILFVNDGSTDNSINVLNRLTKNNKKCRIISYDKNRGKGYAVKKGVEEATGKNIIFIDIDGSINPDEIPRVISELANADVVIADRYKNRENIKQTLLRVCMGSCYSIYLNSLFHLNIKDAVCGLKGFKRTVAKKLFRDLKSKRWIFDIELLYYMKKNNMKLTELPIKWEHKKGSKMRFMDPLKMALQLIILRVAIFNQEHKK